MKKLLLFLLILVLLMVIGVLSPAKVQNIVTALFTGIFNTLGNVIKAFA